MTFENKSMQAANIENTTIDIVNVIYSIFDYKWLLIMSTTLFLVSGLMYTIITPTIYKADALMQIADNDNYFSFMNLENTINKDIKEETEIITSRMILGRVVSDLNLNYEIKVDSSIRDKFSSYFAKGNLESMLEIEKIYIPDSFSPLVLTVGENHAFSINSTQFHLKGKIGTPTIYNGLHLILKDIKATPGTRFVIKKTDYTSTIKNLFKKIKFNVNSRNSRLISISVYDSNPVEASKILNAITKAYVQQDVDYQIKKDSRSLEFIQKQIPFIKKNLDVAEYRLNDYKSKNGSIDLSLESKINLEKLTNIENQINDINFKMVDVMQQYKKEHPLYIALNEKKTTLETERNKISKKISSMPLMQQQIISLSREVDTGRAILLQLLTRELELNISKSSATGNVRIIDSAITHSIPIGPKKVLIVFLSIISGFVFGGMVVFIFIVFRNKGVRLPEDIEGAGQSLFSILPDCHFLSRRKVLNKILRRNDSAEKVFPPMACPLDPFNEAIRNLHTNAQIKIMYCQIYQIHDKPFVLILVTGQN